MATVLVENVRIHHEPRLTRKDGRVTQRPLFSWNRRRGVHLDRNQVIEEWRKQTRPKSKRRTDKFEAWTTKLPGSDQPSGFKTWSTNLCRLPWVRELFGEEAATAAGPDKFVIYFAEVIDRLVDLLEQYVGPLEWRTQAIRLDVVKEFRPKGGTMALHKSHRSTFDSKLRSTVHTGVRESAVSLLDRQSAVDQFIQGEVPGTVLASAMANAATQAETVAREFYNHGDYDPAASIRARLSELDRAVPEVLDPEEVWAGYWAEMDADIQAANAKRTQAIYGRGGVTWGDVLGEVVNSTISNLVTKRLSGVELHYQPGSIWKIMRLRAIPRKKKPDPKATNIETDAEIVELQAALLTEVRRGDPQLGPVAAELLQTFHLEGLDGSIAVMTWLSRRLIELKPPSDYDPAEALSLCRRLVAEAARRVVRKDADS